MFINSQILTENVSKSNISISFEISYYLQVQTEPSRTAKAKAYDVDLQYPVKRANGSMGNLYVAADAKV